MKHILFALLFVPLAAWAAFDEPGNVLKDFEFKDRAGAWSQKGVTKVGVIESFEGLADPLFYLTSEKGYEISQTAAVASNDWYTLQFRCRGEGVLHYAVKENGKTLSAGNFGASGKWARGRAFFHAEGTEVSVIIEARGKVDLGRVFVRKVTKSDRTLGKMFDDPSFESGTPGLPALEWPKATIVTDDVHGGKQAIKFTVTKKNEGINGAGRMMITQGGRCKAGAWVKASKPLKVTFKMTTTSKGVRRFNAFEVKTVGPEKWTYFYVGAAPNCLSSNGGAEGFCLFDFVNETGGPADVWIDDLTTGAFQPDARGDPTKPEKANPSFECGPFGLNIQFQDDPRHFENQQRAIELDETTAAVGSASLKVVKSRMPEDLQSSNSVLLNVLPFRCEADKPYVLSFWAKASKPTCLRAGFPYQGVIDAQVTTEWTRFVSKPTCPKREYHAPGHCELRFSSKADGATIWLDGFQLDYGETVKDFRVEPLEAGVWFDENYKLFKCGSDRRVQLRVSNGSAAELKATVEMKVSDIDGRVVKTFSDEVLIAAGKACRSERTVPTDQPGYYHVNVAVLGADGKALAAGATTYAALLPPKKVPAEKSWAGILVGSDNSGRRGATASFTKLYTGGSFDELMDTIELVGWKWIRVMGPGNWWNTEYPLGTYNRKWDAYFDAWNRRGFKVMLEFLCNDGVPPFAKDTSRPIPGSPSSVAYETDLGKLRSFTEWIVTTYRGKFHALNLLNETGGFPPVEYVKMMKVVYETAKGIAPELIVQGPGYPSSRLPLLDGEKDETWIKKALDLGLNDFNDVQGVHPYDWGHAHSLASCKRSPWETNVGAHGDIPEYPYFREQVKKFKRDYSHTKVVWDTESGAQFNSCAPWQRLPQEIVEDWYTERVAASRVVRCNILRFAAGVERQFYFMFHFNMPYHGLDIMNLDMTPRAGVAALSQFYRMLDGAKHEKEEIRADGAFLEWFTTYEGEKLLVIWNPNLERKRPEPFTLPAGTEAKAVFDMEGRTLETPRMSDSPVYLYLK